MADEPSHRTGDASRTRNVDPRHPDAQRAPGGIGDGLPVLASGEPVVQRWFVLTMLVLTVVGVAVVVWALTSVRNESIPAAERRPPGTAEITHERGQAVLAETVDTEPGPACAPGIVLVGDEGGRATVRTALQALCPLTRQPEFDQLRAGLAELSARGAQARVAVFELTGVDASSRVEDGQLVLELNNRFQFLRRGSGAPALAAEVVHVTGDWPGEPVDAVEMLAALEVQARACEALLPTTDDRPSSCRDAEEVLDSADPVADLEAAGFPPAG